MDGSHIRAKEGGADTSPSPVALLRRFMLERVIGQDRIHEL